MENVGLSDLISEIDSYLRRLFPICRSITGEGNRETLRILQEIIPLSIHEVPSGTKVYDWTIPDEWNIKDAYIADSDSRRIVDFNENNLHVVSYSSPVRGKFFFDEISSRLYCHPELPDAIPYRTSYYKRDWGFCVTQSQFKELKECKEPLEVVIDSTLEPGSLTYGELLLPGHSDQEILLSCYICHPSMANDSLSGVVLTAFLARALIEKNDSFYSYRIVFVPETIGAIAYCAMNEKKIKKIDFGFVITCVCGKGNYGYKQSFNPFHSINAIIEKTFFEDDIYLESYPFDIHGSDERQYSSQGFQINMASITKAKYYEYPEYHSSLDGLTSNTSSNLAKSLDIYKKVLLNIEKDIIFLNKSPNCEPMLSKHQLYPSSGGSMLPNTDSKDELDLILWLLFLCDGKRGIEGIAKQLDVPTETLLSIAIGMEEKGILERVE